MTQEPLFCESLYEAFQSLVLACGGYKRVGADLWPTLPADKAGRDLADCLNPDNARKLNLDEVMSLIRLGQKNGIHTAIGFICGDGGYAPPIPVDPESEKERLQREVLSMGTTLQKALNRLEALTGRAA